MWALWTKFGLVDWDDHICTRTVMLFYFKFLVQGSINVITLAIWWWWWFALQYLSYWKGWSKTTNSTDYLFMLLSLCDFFFFFYLLISTILSSPYKIYYPKSTFRSHHDNWTVSWPDKVSAHCYLVPSSSLILHGLGNVSTTNGILQGTSSPCRLKGFFFVKLKGVGLVSEEDGDKMLAEKNKETTYIQYI